MIVDVTCLARDDRVSAELDLFATFLFKIPLNFVHSVRNNCHFVRSYVTDLRLLDVVMIIVFCQLGQMRQ